MTGRVFQTNIFRAVSLWMVAAALAVGLWSMFAIATDVDPMNYAYARSYLEGQAHNGLLPKPVADQRLAEVRWHVFHWIIVEVRLPGVISLLAIPLLVWLMRRAGDERWVVTWLAVGLAVVVPIVASAPSPIHMIQSASSSAPVVQPGGTPVPTPVLDVGSQ